MLKNIYVNLFANVSFSPYQGDPKGHLLFSASMNGHWYHVA
jgi:hypothetical protein